MIPFTEKQYFKEFALFKVLFLIMFLVTLAASILIFVLVPQNVIAILMVPVISMALIFFFLNSLCLETRIDQSGITYRFRPFHFKDSFIPWSEVNRAYTREYSPLWEYGGYGIRLKAFQRSKAYNVYGKHGLQLELKNGRKVLFGTQKKEELDKLLSSLKQNAKNY